MVRFGSVIRGGCDAGAIATGIVKNRRIVKRVNSKQTEVRPREIALANCDEFCKELDGGNNSSSPASWDCHPDCLVGDTSISNSTPKDDVELARAPRVCDEFKEKVGKLEQRRRQANRPAGGGT